MDGLALLCNLFADGPMTLRRLRAAEVRSLQALELVPATTLAGWLHASLPQARALAEEARRLARRLAEEPSPALALEPPVPARSEAHAVRVPKGELSPQPLPLRSGLIAGLDDAVAARLLEQGVRTFQALIEFTSLTLARRTGIPYSTLLELARHARRYVAARPTPPGLSALAESGPGPTPVRREREAPAPTLSRSFALAWSAAPERGYPAAPEGVEEHPTDHFTLPPEEPESAGPFG